jgi:hypothetical protein
MQERPTRRRVSEKLRKRRLTISRLWHKYPSLPGSTDDINEHIIEIAERAIEALKGIVFNSMTNDDDLSNILNDINRLPADSRLLALDMLETMPEILLGCEIKKIAVNIYPDRDNETLSVEFDVFEPRQPKEEVVEALSRLVVVFVNKAKKE